MFFGFVLSNCAGPPLDDADLVAAIDRFQGEIVGRPREAVRDMLNRQASMFLGRSVTVRSATVSSPYERENISNIYFGTNYDEADHLFLKDIAPRLHDSLSHHRYWISMVKSYPSRQLSYEVAVSEEDFSRLAPGQEVNLTCRIAALIRGKSVYCVSVEIESDSADDGVDDHEVFDLGHGWNHEETSEFYARWESRRFMQAATSKPNRL